jgi:hypothetical protein
MDDTDFDKAFQQGYIFKHKLSYYGVNDVTFEESSIF